MEKNLNRIKVVLADKGKTNKWLSEQLGVAQTTVSKWCTNDCQPPMETIVSKTSTTLMRQKFILMPLF